MKKILMFLCCVLMSNSLWAMGPNCPATRSLSLGLLQNGKDNEFVYTNQEVYDEVRNGSGDRELTKGLVYECGKKGCDSNTLLLAGNDWILASRDYGPKSVAGKLLICSTAGGDSWTDFSFDECEDDRVRNDTHPKWEQRKVENDRLTDCYSRHRSGGFYDFCCFTGEHAACMRAALRGEPALWNGSKCSCGNRDEGDTTQYTWDGKECVTVNGPGQPNNDDSDKIECENSGGDWNGYACECDKETKGLVPDRRNNSDPHLKCKCADSKAKYDKKQNKCVAPATVQPTPSNGNNNGGGSQTQSGGNNGGNGTVVTPPAGGNGGVNIEPQQYECPEPVNGYSYWRAQYKDCEDVIAGLNELEEYCKSVDRKKSGYESRIAGLEKLRDQCKEEAARNQRITNSTAIINETSKKLDDIMAGLKGNVSVWKTAEGNFNGARLASDSIAGVVLGTAGGLITSHLVKKGQVKNGFEDIQCTVGGQKVADWGDEFTVGIR